MPLKAAIPRKFLEQILLQLKANGLVASRRGRAGGYFLVAEPEAITVSQVLRIVDGPIAPLACISRTAYARCKDCKDETLCGVRRLFAETYAATLQKLEKTTLASALSEPTPTGGPPPHGQPLELGTQSTCYRNGHFRKAFLRFGLPDRRFCGF